MTVVADRESDIYEAFALKPANVELLIRASHDRVLEEDERLFAHVGAQLEDGRFSVELTAAPGRKPGPIVMLRGLHTFRAIQLGWAMAGNV